MKPNELNNLFYGPKNAKETTWRYWLTPDEKYFIDGIYKKTKVAYEKQRKLKIQLARRCIERRKQAIKMEAKRG